MYFGQFLVGMSATAVLIAVWTYLATGSFWQALAWTVATLVILQVGYFVLVMNLIFRRAQRATASQDPVDAVPPVHRDGIRH